MLMIQCVERLVLSPLFSKIDRKVVFHFILYLEIFPSRFEKGKTIQEIIRRENQEKTTFAIQLMLRQQFKATRKNGENGKKAFSF